MFVANISLPLNRFASAVVVLLFTLDSPANQSEPDFFAARADFLGNGVLRATPADLNNDGNMDFVLFMRSNFVSRFTPEDTPSSTGTKIVLGNADGTFQDPVYVEDMILGNDHGDFDKDGNVDFFAFTGEEGVRIAKGNGDGTFSTPVVVPTQGTQSLNGLQLAIADFNGDGYLDIASQGTLNSVNIWLNAADGTMNFSITTINSNAQDNRLLGAGDFNKDGHLDIAVVNVSGLVILEGNGNGTFALNEEHMPFENTLSGSDQTKLVVADVNADGNLDVLVSNIANIYCHVGNGDGTFVDHDEFIVGVQPTFVASSSSSIVDFDVAHMNDDDFLDVAAMRSADVPFGRGLCQVNIMTGNEDGSFNGSLKGVGVKTILGGDIGRTVVAGDYNKDGLTDLATFYEGSMSMAVMEGHPEQTFEVMDSAPGEGMLSMISMDVDGDGNTDVAGIRGNQIDILYFTQTGESTSVSIPIDSPFGFTVGELNQDQHNDLLVHGSGGVKVHLGQGNRSFAEAIETTIIWGNTKIADINNDGKNDVISVDRFNGARTYLGNGDATFQDPVTQGTLVDAGEFDVGDIDKDGNLDIAVPIDDFPSNISILWGDGLGSFSEPQTIRSGSRPVVAKIADLDNDGHLDVLLLNAGSATQGRLGILMVALGNGDRTFEPDIEYDAGLGSFAMEVVDFNRDGVLDVVTAQNEGGDLAFYFGNGDGTLKEALHFLSSNNAADMTIADLDGDGGVDVHVVNRVSEVLTMVNNCSFAQVEVPLYIRTEGQDLFIYWSVTAPDNTTLQYSDSLEAPQWQDSNAAVVTEEHEIRVTVPVENGMRFYRLN